MGELRGNFSGGRPWFGSDMRRRLSSAATVTTLESYLLGPAWELAWSCIADGEKLLCVLVHA